MDKYSEFGISFPKPLLVSKGASPVFYVARTSTVRDENDHDVSRAEYFEERVALYQCFVDQAHRALRSQDDRCMTLANEFGKLQHLLDFHVLAFMKFFDPAKEVSDPENFYMEREWRIYGNVDFHLADVSTITVPSSYVDRLQADVPGCGGLINPV